MSVPALLSNLENSIMNLGFSSSAGQFVLFIASQSQWSLTSSLRIVCADAALSRPKPRQIRRQHWHAGPMTLATGWGWSGSGAVDAEAFCGAAPVRVAAIPQPGVLTMG